jgi:putative ABC transport system permease protein
MAWPKCSFVFPHAAGPEIDRDVALLTIALGVGATTLVYSVVYGALLAPLPYAQADRLVIVRTSVPDLRRNPTLDRRLRWSRHLRQQPIHARRGTDPRRWVSPGMFSALGVAPLLGRPTDASDRSAPVVVLSHGLWLRKFRRLRGKVAWEGELETSRQGRVAE